MTISTLHWLLERLLCGVIFLPAFLSHAQNFEYKRAHDSILLQRLTTLAALDSSFLSEADKATLASLRTDRSPLAACAKASSLLCGLDLPPQVTGFELTGMRVSAVDARLDWETLSEYNSKGFVLERRSPSDPLQFDSVSFTAGQGISYGKTRYNNLDPNASPVVTYYRVREVDLFGNFVYSNVVPIAGVESRLAVHVVPNPGSSATSGFYIISASSPTGGFTICNAFGAVLVRRDKVDLSGNTYVPLGSYHLPTGLYILSVYTEKEQTSRKFIIL